MKKVLTSFLLAAGFVVATSAYADITLGVGQATQLSNTLYVSCNGVPLAGASVSGDAFSGQTISSSQVEKLSKSAHPCAVKLSGFNSSLHPNTATLATFGLDANGEFKNKTIYKHVGDATGLAYGDPNDPTGHKMLPVTVKHFQFSRNGSNLSITFADNTSPFPQ